MTYEQKVIKKERLLLSQKKEKKGKIYQQSTQVIKNFFKKKASFPWKNGWVSEWVLFNANLEIFQLYHGENKLIFNEMMMMSALF